MENNKDKKLGKIRPFPVVDEKIQEENEDDIIRDILKREADNYEKKLNSNKDLDNIKGSSHIFESLIQELKMDGKWQEGTDENDPRYQDEDWLGPNVEKTRPRVDSKISVCESKEDLEEAIEDAKKEGLTEEEVYALLSETDRVALDIGKKKMARKKRSLIGKVLRTAVLVCICLFVASMPSKANRDYWLALWNTLTGGEWHRDSAILREDYGSEALAPTKEDLAQEAIENTLGIKAVKFFYKPEGMEFFEYSINPISESAIIQYTYKDVIFNVYMFKEVSDDSMSRGMVMEGKITDTYETKVLQLDTLVNVIDLSDNETEFFTEFSYKDGNYVISGIMSKENFTEILNNISF